MASDKNGRRIEITARAAPPRKPLIEISPDEIAAMVDAFYAEIRRHPRLGPLFEAKIAGNWGPHLERMNLFWRSVLMHSGEYYGQPVVKHNALPDLQEDDFRLWIGLFDTVVGGLFDPARANAIIAVARRIAKSLWLARFGTPFNTAPDWR